MRLFILLFITILYTFASPYSLTHTDGLKYENFSLGYFKDTKSNLSFQQIQNKTFQKATSNFAFGYQKGGSIWFKFDVENKTKIQDFILSLNEHFYEEVELYYKNSAEQNYTTKTNSVFTPLQDREVKSSKLSFPIALSQNDTTTIYLKIKGKYAYFGNIVLFPQSQYNYNQLLDSSTLYIFTFGILTIIVVFSLFLFIRLKEKIYGYYLGYSFFNLFYMIHISGLLAYVGLEQYLYKFHFSVIFMIAFLVLFSMEFLEIKKYLPKINKILFWIIFPLFAIGVFSIIWYEPWNKIISNTAASVCIVLLAIAIRIYFKGFLKSRYYILAIMMYLTSGVIWVIMTQGGLEYNFFTRYIFFFVIPIEATIFTIMLSDRYYDMKEQTIHVQKQLIQEKNHYQTNLENEVKQKTQKLSKLVDERQLLLNEVNHRVKNNFHMLLAMLWFDEQKNENHNHKDLINRVKSLSSIHETLYTSDDLDNINASDYLAKIIQNIHNAYQNQHFTINYDIVDCNLEFEQAMSLGVILNELLTNSIVHNTNSKLFNMTISITIDKHNLYFKYKDNGKGFDNTSPSKGLGLKIIYESIEHLTDKSYKFETDDGVSLEFVMPKEVHGV